MQLVSKDHHGCVLRTDGTIAFEGKALPLTLNVPKLNAIAGGNNNVCGIAETDGALLCWADANEFCGAVNVPPGLNSVAQVAAGYRFTCALTKAGEVSCWRCDIAQYADIFGQLTNVERIAAGSGHACAMQSMGNVVCWGSNESGQSNVPATFSCLAKPSRNCRGEVSSAARFSRAIGGQRRRRH